MCKPHKNVARSIATDPVTGEFDPGKYAVALVAMAKFRIEQYMPSMHGNDGFVPASMITNEAKQAFVQSGLAKSEDEIKAYHDAHISMLKEAVAQTASRHNLTLAGLGIPDQITKDGYKHCEKMPADPTKNGPFLDEAVVALFDGYDRPGFASGTLALKAAAHKPEFSALHAAVADFTAQKDVVPVLKQMFENSLAYVFQTAQPDYDAGRGLKKTDGCVMCHDGSQPDAPASETKTEAKPEVAPQPQATAKSKLIKLSATCGSCAGAASGTILGVMAAHLPCIAIPLIASVTGVALGGVFMTGAMLLTSPIVAATATAGIDKLRGRKLSKTKTFVAAALAFGIALCVTGFMHKGGKGDDCCHMPNMKPKSPPAALR